MTHTAKLIAKTEFIDKEAIEFPMNLEEFTIYVARISSDKENKKEDMFKLLKFLMVQQHWSPFEHAYFTFEIETTRAVSAQIFRHSFTKQEFSQRYSSDVDIDHPEFRLAGSSNRQGSIDEKLSSLKTRDVNIYLNGSIHYYRALIDKDNVAPECARNILPMCTETKVCITGNIRQFFFYLAMRLDQHTQKEHRQIAEQIRESLKQYIPNVIAFLDGYMKVFPIFVEDLKSIQLHGNIN